MINSSDSSGELGIIDELAGFDGRTVVAQWRVITGGFGDLATYVELSPEAEQVLEPAEMKAFPGAIDFYARRNAADNVKKAISHKRHGRLMVHLGFGELRPDEGDGFHEAATMPTAGYLNRALDELPRSQGRFRFYEPQSVRGKAMGPEYIAKLTEGLAPLAAPDRKLFTHDVIDHAVGYALLNGPAVSRIRRKAEKIASLGTPANDRGELEYGSPASKFADDVDNLTAILCAPVVSTRFRYDLDDHKLHARLTGQILVRR